MKGSDGMLTEGKTCIITDYSGLKEKIKKNKPSQKKRERIAKAISSLSADELKRVYNNK